MGLVYSIGFVEHGAKLEFGFYLSIAGLEDGVIGKEALRSQ